MFKRFPLIERKTPIFDFLIKRPTILLDEPILKKLDPSGNPIELPPGVTEEKAVETVAATPWAKGWAEGVAKMAGYKEDTATYREQVKRLSKFVAKRLIGVT